MKLFQNKAYFYAKIRFRILAGVLLLSTGLNAQYGPETIDSLKALLDSPSAADHELFRIYKILTNAYIYTDSEQSLEYAQMGINLAKEKNDRYQTAEFYYNAGNVYYTANQLDSALYCYEQALEMQKQADKKNVKNKEESEYLTLRLFRFMGIIHGISGKYESALNHFFNAMAIAENAGEPEEMAFLCNSIADTYYKMSNNAQAEAYYWKAEKLCRAANDSTTLAGVCLGLCKIFINKEDYAKALEYGEESCQILFALPDVSADQLMRANQQMTDLWLHIPDYDRALQYAGQTLEYARQTGHPSYVATALYMLSTCYLKQGKYRESEQTAFQALETDSANIYLNSILYGNIAQANIWLGNGAKGIEYFSKTMNANRAFSNHNFQSSLSEMEVKYETEKKNMQIVTLEDEKRLMTWLSIAAGGVLLLALTAFFFLWRWNVQKKRLAEKQRELAEQQVKQLEQEKQLVATQAVLDGEVQERTRLARDLHDGLGSILAAAKFSLADIKKAVLQEIVDAECFDNAMNLLDESMHEMRRVAHHLMPESLSRYGLKQSIADFCNSIPHVKFGWYGDEKRIDPKMEVMVYRIMHELVGNALRHSKASEILVQIVQETDRLHLTVQDNGCGFDPSGKSEGMGLANIRTRIAAYNGNLLIDSQPDVGTEINVELRIEN
jgi:signal transduction histidine kinase